MIYAGLVIGGHLNGQRVVCETQAFDVPIISDPPTLFVEMNASTEPVIDRCRYEWKPIYISAQGEQLTVWAPKDATRLDTLKLLLEGYKP
ncbi:hypothetical protein G6M87_11085 [Rhizobium rhizogenes]|uniref:hypothetical protein n=1 Tax=Rhizobium rhizogenes TaxID=359 RepID=UPI0015732525|nr:hypothetical protein [Rhizobium rhizogenes]NTI22402.1 hypothetical protein [Rhizobium rhizogenes]QTG05986.1 hypothetical protein G6M87_11085 [Rhizobium rhizogenes]